MSWRQILKTNHAIILTLPGAVLCSLPLSVIGWEMIDSIPISVSNIVIYQLIIPAVYVLAPIVMVCSTVAMVRFAGGFGNVRRSRAVLLFIPNLVAIHVSMMVMAHMLLFSKWSWLI